MHYAHLFLALSLVATPLAAETLYKSTGPQGEVIYSAKPLPGTKIEKTLDYTPSPTNPLPDAVLRLQEATEQRLRQGQTASTTLAENELHLFTTSWCGYCRQAKAYLAQKQVAYTEHDVETPAGMEALAHIGRAGGGADLGLAWPETSWVFRVGL